MSYCRNCGNELGDIATFCVKCGTAKGNGNSYCSNCGSQVNPGQDVCIKCGTVLSSSNNAATGSIKEKTKFVRVKKGKLIGGVCTGLEKSMGINCWLARVLALFIPFAWIAYLVAWAQVEMVEE